MKKCMLLMMAILLCLTPFATAQQKVIKIGATVAVTGVASTLGDPEKKTLEMLTEELNSKGGVKGWKIEMIIYDNEGDPTKAVTTLKRLITKDGVKVVIGPSRTPDALAMIPVIEEAKIPMLALVAGAPVVHPVKKWVFSTAQPNDIVIEKIASYLKDRKMKKVAIIYSADAFGEDGYKVLKNVAPKYGLELVAVESFQSKDTDMTTQLSKIKAKNPHAVLCWAVGPPTVIVMKNFKQLGMNKTMKLIQSHGVANKKIFQLAGEAGEGVLLPSGKILIAEQLSDKDPQKAALVKYKKDYESRFKEPVSTFGGHAYDAFWMIVKALERVDTNNPERLRDEIEKNTVNFYGTGGVFTYSPTDHNGLKAKDLVMIEWRNGDWRLIE